METLGFPSAPVGYVASSLHTHTVRERDLNTMEFSVTPLRALTLFLLFISTSGVTAQESSTSTTDFSCGPGSAGPCSTYVVYRAQPEFLDVGSISDLFDVRPRWVAEANDLSSEKAELVADQLLLVPVNTCGCTGNRSFANVSYHIKQDDTFFLVSTVTFENLTDYLAAVDLNPALLPTHLQIGAEAVFPIHCKCPTKAQVERGLNYLITYVWRADDSVEKVSRMMNTSVDAIEASNGRDLSVGFPVLIPVSTLPRLPQLSLPGKKKNASQIKRALLLLPCLVGAAALCCLLIFVYRKWSRIRASSPHSKSGRYLPQVNKKPSKDDQEDPCPKNLPDKLLLTGVSDCLDKPVVYRTQAIMEGTGNLDERCRLGGAVFRATINGEVFAVKKAEGDVSEELKILHKVNHANLVKLTGISTSPDGDFFLVYEYAHNGSLDKWLHPEAAPSSSSATFLSWRQRLSVALDVADGLQYLHEHTSPSIVHGGIEAANVLLNAHFKAKISNFSKARPATDGGATPTADVFAFGVLLLELLSGRKATETSDKGEVAVMRTLLEAEEGRGERLRRWMDPNLEGFYPVDGALSLAAMARVCTSENPYDRPSSAEISFGLSVLAQSCMDSPWASDFYEKIEITNPIFAR
uniref:LRR receptor-like serine/threonine-protein kinase GSO1 n=1 Tax=Anthurium amnicola TaxID=1678845 RepID=A0A1D1YAP8_9ARAE